MALIKYSAVVGAASGKVGGVVLSSNGNGAYVKGYVKPVNPNTSKQQVVREQFGALTTSWRALTDAQRQRWSDAAPQFPYQNRLGDSKIYSGFQLFVKLNAFGTVTLDEPILVIPPTPATFTQTSIEAGAIVFDLGVPTSMSIIMSAIGTADESFVIHATPPLSAGIRNVPDSWFRLIEVKVDASAGLVLDILSAYQDVFGDPQEGDSVAVRLVLANRPKRLKANNGQIIMKG